MKSTNSYIRK